MTLLIFALVFGFAVSLCQPLIASRSGSDHSVHEFLVNIIRENGHRLFTRVPRIINPSYLGAYPIFLHMILARLPKRWLPVWSVVLNPTVTLAIGVMLAVALQVTVGTSAFFSGLVVLTYLLTPQHFHAFSARNFGISSRSLGILLFTGAFLAFFAYRVQPDWWHFAVVAVLVYLIIGFNTFAFQALIIISAGYVLLSGDGRLLACDAVGLILFVVLHPRYAVSYLKHTAMFVDTYRREIADRYILLRRYSIWRDLVFDIWKNTRKLGLPKTLMYAYGNSVLIVVFLNFLTTAAGLYWLVYGYEDALTDYCGSLAFCGVAAAVATSFRPTRFLGEPERYVEICTGFGSIAGVTLLARLADYNGIFAYVVLCTLMIGAQLMISHMLRGHVSKYANEITQALAAIRQRMPDQAVRFSANNDEVIKYALGQPWTFARVWSAEMPFAGKRMTEVYTEFPAIAPAVFASAVEIYGLNAVIVDDEALSPEGAEVQAALSQFTKVFDGKRYNVYVRV